MDNAVVIFGSSFPSDQEYTQVIVWHVIHFIYMQNIITKTRLLVSMENIDLQLYITVVPLL